MVRYLRSALAPSRAAQHPRRWLSNLRVFSFAARLVRAVSVTAPDYREHVLCIRWQISNQVVLDKGKVVGGIVVSAMSGNFLASSHDTSQPIKAVAAPRPYSERQSPRLNWQGITYDCNHDGLDVTAACDARLPTCHTHHCECSNNSRNCKRHSAHVEIKAQTE